MATANFVAFLPEDVTDYRAAAFSVTDLESIAYSAAVSSSDKVFKAAIAGLAPGDYRIYLEKNGTFYGPHQKIIIPHATNRRSFKLWSASCARTNSNHPIFDEIQREGCELGVHTGDLHYRDIDVNDAELFRDGYRGVFAASRQAALYRSMRMLYIWDDHDYGPNNSGASAPGREAACLAYRQCVPHPTLPEPDADGAVYHRQVHGRVVFLITDLRSRRASIDIMGATQEAWFIDQLSAEANEGKLIIWVNTVPWIGEALGGNDSWRGYSAARTRIADAIKAAGVIGRFLSINGDMHGCAIDDGTNTDYATGGGAAFPLAQFAPLDQSNSTKGGPWEITGPHATNENQVGIVEIDDDRVDPDEIGVTMTAKSMVSGELTNLHTPWTWVANVGPAP